MSDKQLVKRVHTLEAALKSIETAVAKEGGQGQAAATAALAEQTKRGADAVRGLHAAGAEVKKLNKQVCVFASAECVRACVRACVLRLCLQITDLVAEVASLNTQLHAAVAGNVRRVTCDV